MKKIFTLLFISILSVTVSAQVFWTEDFGSTCRFRGHADTYAGGNGAWTVTAIGQNDAYGNDWFVNDRANNNGIGNCSNGNDMACQTSPNNTLHVGGVTMPVITFLGFPIYNGAPEDSASYWTGYFAQFDATKGATTNKRVESPTINCTGQSNISIAFDFYHGGDVAGGLNGNCTFWYYDGTTWSQLINIPKTQNGGCNGSVLGVWVPSSLYPAIANLRLPASANNNPSVKIGFKWDNNSVSGGSDPSAAFDNIALSSNVISANPPVAKITRTDSVGCSPYCITGFADNSTNSPTSWLWTFTGGSPASSTLQNPGSVCYTAAGNYSVKLKATNAGGSDSVTLTNLVHINGSPLTPTISRHGADTLCSSTDASYTSYEWIYGASTASGNTPCIKITHGAGNYSVKVKNANQCEAASQITVGITGYSFDNKVSIYPSPATHELTVTGNWQASDGRLSVYDIIGKKVKDYAVRLEDKMLVNVKDLPDGMYFIKVENEKGSWTGKFEKE